MTDMNQVHENTETMTKIHLQPKLDKQQIIELLKTNSVNDRIGCEKLRKLAKENGLPSRDLGKIAKENNIKIVACELGCF